MALTDILNKIEKETELKLREIENDFEKKKQALQKSFEEKKIEIEKNINKSIEEKSENIMEKARSLSYRENENSLLSEKRKLINECLEETIDTLAKSKEYEAFLTGLISIIPFEEGEIVAAKNRRKETEQALKASKKKFEIAKEEIEIVGGFIFKTDKIEIDNSFETIIQKQLREDLEIKLNKILFK